MLSLAQFWDERYAKADGDKPTHEWLCTFDGLEPFLESNLYRGREDQGKDVRILHLGSGDSVCTLFLARNSRSATPVQAVIRHDHFLV